MGWEWIAIIVLGGAVLGGAVLAFMALVVASTPRNDALERMEREAERARQKVAYADFIEDLVEAEEHK